MVENININCIKKVLSEESKFLNEQLSSKDFNFYDNAKVEIDNFIQNGTTFFQRKEIIFGDEEMVDIKIEQSLADISVLEISKAIVSFNGNQTNATFNNLINAYILDLLTFVAASEDFKLSPVSYLESDIGLLYILTITFCPELLEKVEPIILKGLEYRQQVRDNNIRPMPGSYGRDSILYLAYYMAKEKRSEKVATQILRYCNKKIVPSYINAIEHVYSNDETTVIIWVNELVEYHIKKSKTSDLTYPYHRNHWIYFPIEIIGLFKIRFDQNLNTNFISHPLINIFLPFLTKKLEFEPNVLLLLKKLL